MVGLRIFGVDVLAERTPRSDEAADRARDGTAAATRTEDTESPVLETDGQRIRAILGQLANADRAPGVDPVLISKLGAIGGPDVVIALLKMLSGELTLELRYAVVVSWPKDSLDAAEAAIPDANPKARASLVEILGRSRDVRFAPTVVHVSRESKDNGVLRKTIGALGKFGDRASEQRLIEISVSRPEYIEAVEHSFRGVRNGGTLDSLCSRWESWGATGRSSIFFASTKLPALSSVLEGLAIQSLSDPELQVRTAAALALGRPAQSHAVAAIDDYLRAANSSQDRLAGVQALSRIGTAKAAVVGLRVLESHPEDKALASFRNALKGRVGRE